MKESQTLKLTIFPTSVRVCARLCWTLCDPMDCSPPGSSVHGVFQARLLEWVAISCSRGSFQPRGQTHPSCISCIGSRFFTNWASWEAHFPLEG